MRSFSMNIIPAVSEYYPCCVWILSLLCMNIILAVYEYYPCSVWILSLPVWLISLHDVCVWIIFLLCMNDIPAWCVCLNIIPTVSWWHRSTICDSEYHPSCVWTIYVYMQYVCVKNYACFVKLYWSLRCILNIIPALPEGHSLWWLCVSEYYPWCVWIISLHDVCVLISSLFCLNDNPAWCILSMLCLNDIPAWELYVSEYNPYFVEWYPCMMCESEYFPCFVWIISLYDGCVCLNILHAVSEWYPCMSCMSEYCVWMKCLLDVCVWIALIRYTMFVWLPRGRFTCLQHNNIWLG